MSALVPPDAAPAPGLPIDFENFLIAQLEAQQTHIARELHDALGSRLAAIVMMLAAMKTAPHSQAASPAALDHVIAHAQDAAEVVRKLARGLMPVDDTPGALWRLLERLCADYDQIQGLRCEFVMHGDFDHLAPDVSNHLYRIAQEAITNALRDGHAKCVSITLTQFAAHREMAISDDGDGFSTTQPNQPQHHGLGLRNMRARSAIINADLSIQPGLSGGTTLKVTWPSLATHSNRSAGTTT
jgi:signal transduction histidine kinase